MRRPVGTRDINKESAEKIVCDTLVLIEQLYVEQIPRMLTVAVPR